MANSYEDNEDDDIISDNKLPELMVELPEYKGLAVIIGNTYTREFDRSEKDCEHLLALNGPRKDTEAMKEAFDYLRFLTIVRHDLTLDETNSFLRLLAHHRYPEVCKRFVFTFSGHGRDGFVCCEDGRPMKISDIVELFSPTGNKSLAGVSRLFFFDACRGESLDQGIVARGGEGEWQSKIPSTGDVLVAYATTTGYKAFEQFGGGLWTSILAKKLVTSLNSVYDILTEVNKELITTIQKLPQAPSFQQPELLGRLNGIVNLLQESGQQPKKVEKETPLGHFLFNPSISSRRSPSNDTEIFKSPKSKLNEWCQSMKFLSPKYYQSQTSDNYLVVTVSIMIEGQKVQYSYTSEQMNSTKKFIKECEENAAEIAYSALTELYETSASVVPPQHTQSYDEQTDPSEKSAMLQKTPSCPGFGSPSKKAKSQLNELFQKHKIAEKYSSSDDVTDGNVHNFRATLTYTVHGRRYRYESRGVFGRKQDAEEDAAQQALSELERQLKQPGGVSYKQLLKERHCDKQQLPAPEYTTRSSGGGFVSTVNVPQYKPVTGSVADSKKEAEQLAAMEALRQLKIDYQ